MTWQVPGAKVEIAEFPPDLIEPRALPSYAVRLELAGSEFPKVLGSDTALALAAALVDAAHRCDERAQADLRRRAKLARQQVQSVLAAVRRTGEGGQTVPPKAEGTGWAEVAEGYAADIEGS